MNRGLLLLGSVGLILVLVCLSCSNRSPGRSAHPAHGPGTSSRAPAGPTASRPSRTAADAARLLPFPPEQITRAAQLAQAFVATYSTHRYNEPPTDYLQRLAPMMSPSLRAVLERTATDPAVLVQRQRTQETTVAEARMQAIRELGPGSITFVVTAIEHLTTAYATRQDTIRYAVTTVGTTGGGWRVYDVELAATGQAGDSGEGIP
jgi:hypothetical protein